MSSSVVQSGAFELVSNHESAADMAAVLAKPEKADESQPRIRFDGGKPVEDGDKAPSEVSKAASELGKRGAEAAKQAREAKQAQPAEEPAPAEDGKPEQAPEDKRKGNPRHDPEARVRQATSQLAEERRARQALEQRLAALEQERQNPRQSAPEPQQQAQPRPDARQAGGDEPEPQEADFDDYKQYVKAQARWETRQEIREQIQQAQRVQAQQQQQSHVEKAVQTFNERLSKAAEADPDFMGRIAPQLLELQPSFGRPQNAGQAVADEIIASEHAPALLRRFSENPEELQALMQSPDPRTLMRRFALIEAEVARDAEAPRAPSRPSQAPPPIRPLAASSVSPDEPLTGEVSFDEYVKRSRARRR